MDEIVCKWWSDKLSLGITEDKRVLMIRKNGITELKKEFHMGRPHWRIVGTSKRYSDLQINKSVTVQYKILQHYCPF